MNNRQRHPIERNFRRDPAKTIERRIIEAMIYIVHVRGWKPGAIYLTEADMALLKEQRHRSEIDGIPVRLGKSSRLFGSKSWSGRAI